MASNWARFIHWFPKDNRYILWFKVFRGTRFRNAYWDQTVAICTQSSCRVFFLEAKGSQVDKITCRSLSRSTWSCNEASQGGGCRWSAGQLNKKELLQSYQQGWNHQPPQRLMFLFGVCVCTKFCCICFASRESLPIDNAILSERGKFW